MKVYIFNLIEYRNIIYFLVLKILGGTSLICSIFSFDNN
jgi:hypothetical protein